MGYTVLYIAFGVVALWLLGEVLLQYKARLRWRALAFTGFMGVVTGVAMRSVVVIALGAIAFAAGQAIVTMSYRRGFSTGWAVGGRPGASRRRRVRGREWSEPTLSVTPVEPVDSAAAPDELPVVGFDEPSAAVFGEPSVAVAAGPGATGELPVYQPEALLDDTGEYASYTGASYGPGPDPYIQHEAVADGYGYDTAAYAGGGYQDYHAPTAYPPYEPTYTPDQPTYTYPQDGYTYDQYPPTPAYPQPPTWNDTPYPPTDPWLPHQQSEDLLPPAPADPNPYDEYRY
jgi:hypothetical protein